jgi:hypothetical protein
MKKILVKNENNEVIDESGILASQEEVDFFISQRPQFICEVVDVTAQVAQEKINAEALAYLAATDWMVVREVETQVPCPVDVKQLRAEARLRVVR